MNNHNTIPPHSHAIQHLTMVFKFPNTTLHHFGFWAPELDVLAGVGCEAVVVFGGEGADEGEEREEGG